MAHPLTTQQFCSLVDQLRKLDGTIRENRKRLLCDTQLLDKQLRAADRRLDELRATVRATVAPEPTDSTSARAAAVMLDMSEQTRTQIHQMRNLVWSLLSDLGHEPPPWDAKEEQRSTQQQVTDAPSVVVDWLIDEVRS